MSKSIAATRVSKTILYSLILIIAAMPFHGFMSTYLGSLLDQREIMKAWKEILLGLVMAFVLVDQLRNKKIARDFYRDKISVLVIVYTVLTILMALFLSEESESALVGIIFNLRYLAIFMVGFWLSHSNKALVLSRHGLVTKLLGIGLLLSSIVAVMQSLFLPSDFMSNFGYGEGAIREVFYLDQNESLIRGFGLSRGPNVLGISLALIIPFFAKSFILRITNRSTQADRAVFYMSGTATLLLSLALYTTYSRSGWIAVAGSLGITLLLSLPRKYYKKLFYWTAGVALIGLLIIVPSISSSATLQTLILHDDPNRGGVDSTTLHFRSKADGIRDVVSNPLGSGVGSAGPASRYRADKEPRISENYFIQIAQEIGLPGLALLLSIFIMVGMKLFRYSSGSYANRVLLGSLIGICLAAMFGHTWADEEVALAWWGLAGLFISSD